MAHSFGKSSTRTSSAGNPITTASFTVDQGETVLALLLKIVGASDRAGGTPSYAGLPMIQANTAQKAAASPEAIAELWYLLAPPIGTATCSIPNTGALTIFYTLATGKAKAGGHSALDVTGGANGTSANPAPGSVTTTEDGDIGLAVVASGAQTWSPSARAGTQIAETDDGAHGGGEQYHLQATKAAIDLGWTFGTSDDWGAVCAYFKEVPPHSIGYYQSPRCGDGMSVYTR